MEYRILGKTGLRVSEIGFGCGNVGGLMVRGSHREQIEAVSYALGLGVNYFDTAPAYGNGRSETNLGQVLKELQPDVVVATKVGINSDDMGDLKGAVESSLETSLSRLGRDSVDVLQLHTPISLESAETGRRWSLSLNDVLGTDGIGEAFESVRSQGLVRFLGFTGLGETEALHRVIDSERFDLVQAYYNLLNPSAGVAVPSEFKGHNFSQLINRAKQRNMGVVVIRVMAGGALGGKVARSGFASPSVGGAIAPGAEYETDETRAGKLDFMLKDDLTSLPQAAVRFALSHQDVSTVLVGYSNLGQIELAAGCSGKKPLSKTVMEKLRALWSTDFGI
ncbi:MAG: aldo/keto reductase [Dehalococcoidales bacterium]